MEVPSPKYAVPECLKDKTLKDVGVSAFGPRNQEFSFASISSIFKIRIS